jgi:hypothetical protein
LDLDLEKDEMSFYKFFLLFCPVIGIFLGMHLSLSMDGLYDDSWNWFATLFIVIISSLANPIYYVTLMFVMRQLPLKWYVQIPSLISTSFILMFGVMFIFG